MYDMVALVETHAKSAVVDVARPTDRSEWGVLAPPADEVTRAFLAARPECVPLVCVDALDKASGEVLLRGSAFPFVFGECKSNGLAAVRGYVAGQMSARAVRDDLCSARDGLEFCVEGTPAWHLFKVHRLLTTIAPSGGAVYTTAVAITSHSAAGGFDRLAAAARQLACAAYVVDGCDKSSRPSPQMQELVFAACTGEIDPATVEQLYPGFTDEARAVLVQEVTSLFPRVVDVHIETARVRPGTREDAQAAAKVRALCMLYNVTTSGLRFEV